MPRWVVKLLALVGTFLLPLICTLLPYKVSGYIVRKGAFGKRILSYLMCLGGGIFFGTYLLHMGPEVQTILKDALLDPYEITYPVAELIVGVGFFIVLFAEKLVLRWNKRRIHKRKKTCHVPTMPVVTVGLTDQSSCWKSNCVGLPSGEMCPECIEGKQCSRDSEKTRGNTHHKTENHESQSADIDSSSHLLTGPVATQYVAVASPSVTASTSAASNCHMSDTGQDEKRTKVEDNPQKQLSSDLESGSVEIHGGHHHATRSLILILALSLHRIFEGMSIGLQHSVANVVSLFGAVMCHEMVIGFSLGLQFVRSGFELRRLLITSFVCSLIMPLGVFIGIVMTEIESSSSNIDIANGLLQAIAMGTFIYVTFFEILQEEIDSEDTSLGKVVFIAAGFALMALLNLIPEGNIDSTSTSHWSTSTLAPSVNATLLD